MNTCTATCNAWLQSIQRAHANISTNACETTCNTWIQSIRRAHANIKPGKLRINSGELLDANANRSPSAYLHNPEDERARYKHNTDKMMTQLSVTNSEGKGERTAKMVPQACKHVRKVNKAGVCHGTMYGDTTLGIAVPWPTLINTYSLKETFVLHLCLLLCTFFVCFALFCCTSSSVTV